MSATATAAAVVAVATASMNARVAARDKSVYNENVLSENEKKERELDSQLKEELKRKYFETKKELTSQICASRTEDKGELPLVNIRYFDKNGNLLIEEKGWKGMVDGEVTTKLYSQENGKVMFSDRCYSSNTDGCVSHYIDSYDGNGNCNTEKFFEDRKKEIKHKELEQKIEKREAKRRLRRMKVKKFFNDIISR
ncbi:MAG: hypothetical protein IKW39_01815 [Alphaproteobacteria bacterium]|nr:hypothetical protein [Alphaproteobacteria bacterium]